MLDQNLKNRLWAEVKEMDQWIRKNGFAGYDPYDLKGHRLLFNPTNAIGKFFRTWILRLESIAPLTLRKLFAIKKSHNAKGMGLFADTYLKLYEITGDQSYMEQALKVFDWLEVNKCSGYHGDCWGYDFDWLSRVVIPAKTPGSVVSVIIGKAYLRRYHITKEDKWLDTCKSICEFILYDLYQDQIDSDTICFSWTPIDKYHVHNANLLSAEFLMTIGNECGNKQYIEKAGKAVNYAVKDQNVNGSLFYWAKDQNINDHIDHYHAGFEMRSLHNIWKITGGKKELQCLKKYYQFYLKNLFSDNFIPKFMPNKIYPIDIHACAEVFKCNSQLKDLFPEGRNVFLNAVNWTLNNMKGGKGWYIYRINKKKGIRYKTRIPYIRWGQAWMFNGIVCALYEEFKNQ